MTDTQIQNIIQQEGGNFTPHEFLSDRRKVKKEYIMHLARWRKWFDPLGYKFQITSTWRPNGSHIFGLSGDGLIWDKWKETQPDPMVIWRLMTTYPWTGVGMYFDWDNGIGSHMDLLWPPERDRPLRWLRAEGKYFYQHPVSGKFIHNSKDNFAVVSLEQMIDHYHHA